MHTSQERRSFRTSVRVQPVKCQASDPADYEVTIHGIISKSLSQSTKSSVWVLVLYTVSALIALDNFLPLYPDEVSASQNERLELMQLLPCALQTLPSSSELFYDN